MHYIQTSVLLGLLSALAVAQSPSAPSAPAASDTYTSNTVIKVGTSKGGIVFEPSSAKVSAGHTVTFSFWPSNHSVVQGSFDKPCQPLDGGIFSGFHAVAFNAADSSRPTFTITVNDTKPIWFYCSEGSHCQGGMVGVINPPTSGSNTLAKYKSASAGASSNESPSNGPQGGVTGPAANTTSSGGDSSSTVTPSGTATATTAGAAGLKVYGVGFTVVFGAVLAAVGL